MHRILLSALAAAMIAPAPALAAPRWVEPAPPFGELAARQNEAGAVMASDGRIVFARIAPDGALEVRERPPGGPVGAPVTLADGDAADLRVLMGVDGTAAVLFDDEDERYAAVRAPGGGWGDPRPLGPAGADPGTEAVTSSGQVWRVAPAPEAGRLALYRGAGVILLPAPAAGARDTAPVLVLPRAGGAQVVYVEEGATAEAGQCVGKTVVHAVDISTAGAVSPRAT